LNVSAHFDKFSTFATGYLLTNICFCSSFAAGIFFVWCPQIGLSLPTAGATSILHGDYHLLTANEASTGILVRAPFGVIAV
jgi:hypothetical protein